MNVRIRYILPLATLLLTACSDDSEPTPSAKELTVVAAAPSFLEVGTTRTLPVGYVSYNMLYPTTLPEHAAITLIAAQTDGTKSSASASLSSDAEGIHHWTANIDITHGTQYYFYGFMPSKGDDDNSVAYTIAANGADFSKGATLTIQGLSTLTPADVCAVVGVYKGTEAVSITSDAVPIRLGQFGYLGSESDNYVYLLLKHLYAGLHIRTRLDSEYAKLRTIRIKRMALSTATPIATKKDITVTLTANASNSDPVTSITYADVAGPAATATATLYEAATDGTTADERVNGFAVPVETPESFLSCFAPGGTKAYKLVTEYDVYDSKGNLIRKDCTATNALTLSEGLAAGQLAQITLTIQPTYLYVLSEPDLDSPTFTIE